VNLDQDAGTKFQHGNPAAVAGVSEAAVRVYGPENRLLGLGEVRPDGMVYPKKVFVW